MDAIESGILARLTERFPALGEARAVTAARRIFLNVPADDFLDILAFAVHELGFGHLCAITGLDDGGGFEFIYHISNLDGVVLNLKYQTRSGDGVVIPSVLPVFNGASFYERELEGLLGVKVDGLPKSRQYPLPDNWPEGQYPMRKDWKPAVTGILEGGRANEQDNDSVGAAAPRPGGAGKLQSAAGR